MVSYEDVPTGKLAELAALALGKAQADLAVLQELGAELLGRLGPGLTAETVGEWLLDESRTEEELSVTVGAWLDRAVQEVDEGDVPADPPTVPAVPVSDTFHPTKTITLDPAESEYDQARRVASLWCRGTRLLVPQYATVAPLRLGSGFLAGFADGSPVRDIEIQGGGSDSGISGIEIHPPVEGTVRFRDVQLSPMSEHDKAPLRTVGPCYHAVLDLAGCAFWSPYDGFDGFGMMWGMAVIGSKVKLNTVVFDAAKEHGLYAMNSSGIDANHVENRTRSIGGQLLGMGRTLLTHQNRVDDVTGAIGGTPSTGTIRFANAVARRCGHEGLLQGGPPSGGSDFTIGGHTGTVTMQGIVSADPYCGGIAVWNERAPGAKPRAWQSDGEGSIWHPKAPRPLGWSVDDLIVEGYQQERTDVAQGRTPILVSGCGSASLVDIDGLVYKIDHQGDVPPCGVVSFGG